MADNVNWYVVHTYSGYENTVKATIEKYVENRHLQDVIHEISIPLETVTEITDNGPKEVERKVGAMPAAVFRGVLDKHLG